MGIAPHQISSLVCRKKAHTSSEVCRKISINESSDFAAIAHVGCRCEEAGGARLAGSV